MLSLTAMAALPMAGFADATWSVPANNSSITDWAKVEGTDLSSSSTEQIIGIGAGISRTINWVNGTYVVGVETLKLANADLTICVGDKVYHPGEKFTLNGENPAKNEVTLKVTRKDAGEDGKKVFTVGGISVKLIFNFTAAQTNLTTALTDAVGAKLDNAAEGSWKKVLSAQKTAIVGEIAALEEGKATYETYKEAELYKIPSKSSKIEKAIQHLADCIAVLEAFDEMDTDLADLKTEITSEFAKEKYEGKVKELETDINNFKAGFDYSKNYENLFATTTKDGWLDDVNNAKTGYKATIKDYSTKIKDANEDAAAFNRVAGLIATAKGNYYTYQTDLKFHGNDDYATLSTNALEKLAAAYLPILKQEDIKCFDGYHNQEAKYRETIEAAEDAMSKVRNTFMGYYDNLEQTEFATLNGYAESVKKYEEAISDDELTVDANYAQKAKEAIQNAKDELKKVMADVSDDGLTLPENYYALRDAANDAVNYLKVNYLLASANSAFTAANTAVEGLFKGEYHESSFWTEKVKSIQQTLNTFGGYTDDEKVENEKVISDIYSTICAYKVDAQAAFGKYDAVTYAIDIWTKKYDAVVAFVDNRTVPFESTTYGKALEDAKNWIDSNQTALNTALTKENTDADSNAHATAMKELALDTDYPAILDATEKGYIAAKNKYELPQTIASAQSLAAEVEAKAAAVLAKLKLAYDTYNGNKDDYGKRYADEIWGKEDEAKLNPYKKENFWSIRQRYYNVPGVEQQEGETKGVYTAVTTSKDAKYEEAIKNITTLKEHLDTFVVINKAVDDLNTLAAQIKAAFKANNDAYDEFVKSLKAAKEEAEKIKTENKDTSREKEFSDLYDEVTKSLGDDSDFKKSLDDSKEKETFIADEDGFNATLKGIKNAIDKAIKDAEASTANYNAKEDLLKKIKTNLYETDDTNNNKTVAVLTEINKVDNPGHTHFAEEVKKLATAIGTLESNVESDYKAGKASTKKAEHEAEITRIKNEIAAAVPNCKANDENYAKLDALNKKVEDFYIKIYYKISETDKTSKKQEWLDSLAAITTVDQKAIDDAFAEGGLSTAAKYQEYDDLYSVRKAAIEDINLSWIDPSGYLKSVGDANDAEFATIKKAYKDAVDVYLDAIAGLKPFLDYNGDDQRWNVDVAKHNAKIFNLKKDLDAAYAEATTKHDDMAKANGALTTPETVEKAQYFDGSAWYSKTTDAQGELQEDGSIYDARVAISTAYKTAIDALNADTKTQLTNAIYAVETAVNTAIRGINTSMYAVYQGDGTQTAREKFFATVDAELKTVNDLLVQDQLAVNYLSSKGTTSDYDEQIAAIKTSTLTAALNALAEAQYKDWIADKNAKHTELYGAAYEGANKGLFKLYADIATKGYQAAFEAAEAALNENLSQLGEDYTPTYGSTEMDDLYSYFIDFKSNNGYKEFKNAIGTYKDSEAAYEKFIKGTEAAAGDTYINEVQRIIDNEAKTYAPDFIVAADTIAGVQARLDALVADANTFRATYGMATHYPTLLSQLRTVKAAAKDLMADINQAEYDELVFQLANLKSDYNQALIEGNKESDAMNVYHEKILGYETALTLANFDMSDTKKDAEEETAPAVVPFHTYDKLRAIQDSIIADRNALADVRVDVIYKALNADLKGLTERYNTMAQTYGELYACQQKAIAIEADKSATLQASVDASKKKGWMLIEEKSLKDQIDAWKTSLAGWESAVADAKDLHDTDAAARQRLQAELKDCQTYVDNMLNNGLFKLFDVKSYWEHSTYKSNYERFVQNNADIYSDPESDGQLKTENSKLGYIDRHNNNIKNCERWIYNQEVSLRYTSNTEEYTCVNTALDNLNGLLKNENILYRDTHDASYNELDRKAQAAWTFFNNIRWNGNTYYTYVDIDGNDIAYTSYDHQAFVTEVVPAVIKRIESILADAETLKANIEENTYVPGDLSGDKKVSLADFATLQSIILSKPEVDDEVQKAAADLNKDGFVDISDLMLLVRQILTPTAPAPARVRVAIPHATTNDAVSVIVEGEGVHQRIGIMLDAEQAYAGCQMDITLPEGVTLAEETTGEMAGALSLLSNDLENGSHRILLSSVEGLTMATGNGALLWLDVNVDHNYNGEGIGLSNVLFANSFGRAFELSVAAGETTGLSNVSMTQEVKEKIYNVGGILMDGLKRGVNIIRGNDGSSKKIIVK